MNYWGIDMNANSIESTILRDPQHSHTGWCNQYTELSNRELNIEISVWTRRVHELLECFNIDHLL